VEEVEGSPKGNRTDNGRRLSITGPCEVKVKDGLRRLYEEVAAARQGGVLS
jgi:hypothetical protein